MGKRTDFENGNAVNDPVKVLQGLSIILGGMQMILESVSNPPGKLSGSLLEKEMFAGEKEQATKDQEPEESQEDDDLPPEEETAQEEDSNQSADQADRDDTAEKDNSDANESPDADESPDSDESSDSDENQPQDDVQDKTKDPITKETLTRVVVSKLKQDRSYSDRINKLVNSYGVSQISDLPEDQYESFLSEITRM